MRVLHFLNIPITADQLKSGGNRINTSGGWMAALLARILEHSDITLGCAAFGAVGKLQALQEGRATSFVMPAALSEKEAGLNMCRDLVNEWKPDLIHIHGTESCFGLLAARNLVKCPVVISLQGLLGPYSEWYHFFGNRSLSDVFRMHRWLEIPLLRGQLMGLIQYKKYARREKEIISGNRFFMGRTTWDRAYIQAGNPSAKYFYGGELLRDAFWGKRWDIAEVKRHRVIFTNAGHPRKGTEILLDAVKLMQPDYPDIEVAIVGGISQRSGYGRYIRRKIGELGRAAIELGSLNAGQMAEELAKTHVFASPSFIDNSPNAVCEAQLLGMPVISSYTGGVPSLIEDNRTGLFFPNGDVPMLVAKLREIFENDDLARRLGAQAHEVACRRHDPDLVVREILEVYEDVMRNAL